MLKLFLSLELCHIVDTVNSSEIHKR